MQFFNSLGQYRPQALAVLRIIAALLFIEHGTMKLFGFPAPMGDGALPPLLLIAALLEVVGGALLVVGFMTRPVAFLLSGQMAVAYFMAHASKGFWPALNGGEGAILFCFIFLYLVFSGPGAWAVDKS
ncbi:putative oxidoreductase [Rhizobium soli]|jgi:putative oxidoreductase|uniref:Putative oxidoreductase n=1 Tax=Rhizobium soli TaxID=424798 RepID=A0A7X0JLY1_9HYPH|nr:DoxX family protein [Rhizobium soli]MBB6509469.1 putative oxidoreductase [Rhizobium soli]